MPRFDLWQLGGPLQRFFFETKKTPVIMGIINNITWVVKKNSEVKDIAIKPTNTELENMTSNAAPK
jgi:hypothetical protein